MPGINPIFSFGVDITDLQRITLSNLFAKTPRMPSYNATYVFPDPAIPSHIVMS